MQTAGLAKLSKGCAANHPIANPALARQRSNFDAKQLEHVGQQKYCSMQRNSMTL
jgi:hypothetical protein